MAATLVIALLGCDDSDDSGGGGQGGVATGGQGGVAAGGQTQIPSEDAKSAEECQFLGAGGSDLVYCDYVTVEFSEPLPMPGVEVEVDTSIGDHLTLDASGPGETRLLLELSEGEEEALGFVINSPTGMAGHYSPESLSAVVRHTHQIVGEAALEPTYSCVEITVDDWCWKGEPETISVTPP